MFKLKGNFFIIIFYTFLGVFFCTNVSQAVYQSPPFNPVSGNDLNTFIYNDLGDDSIYIYNTPFGVGGDFTVDDDLFVEVSSSRVGIGTNAPEASLDVDGVVRIPTDYLANFPTCTSLLEGTFMFNLDQDRLNICFNGSWRRIGYDGDLDTWLDSKDCDDSNPNIYPYRSEVCGDNVDDNCDGSLTLGCNLCFLDNDGDGYGDPSDYVWVNPGDPCAPLGRASNSDDCDDNDPNLNPDSEVCGDTVSNDCDALVNEGCACTVSEFTALACPDMSSCDNHVNLTATKLTDCTGSTPTLFCTCVCRVEHFYSPVPPVCPVCRSTDTTVYSTKVSGVTCTDSNSISDTFCPDNCSAYCSGTVCCNYSTYTDCSGSYKVYHDACGGTSSTYCTYGCSWGTCNTGGGGGGGGLCPCGNWQPVPGGGQICVCPY